MYQLSTKLIPEHMRDNETGNNPQEDNYDPQNEISRNGHIYFNTINTINDEVPKT